MSIIRAKKEEILELIKDRIEHIKNKRIEEEEISFNIHEEPAFDELSFQNLSLILKDFKKAGILNTALLQKWGDGIVDIEKLADHYEFTIEYVIVQVTKEFNEKYEQYIKKLSNSDDSSLKHKRRAPRHLNLPPNTQWRDITIKFKDEYEIGVFVKNEHNSALTYKDMGCFNSKTKKPDLQWGFLIKLSTAKGELNFDEKEKDRNKQYKGKLSRILCECFGIKDSPFEEAKSCKTVFKIEPESSLRGDGELFGFREKEDRYDISETLQEETGRESHRINTRPPDL